MTTYKSESISSQARITILFCIFLFFMFPSCRSSIVITSNGRSEYRIVIPEMPSQPEVKAARELQAYLQEISGVMIPVVADTGIVMQYEILLGNNSHLSMIGIDIDIVSLQEDGFIIKTIGDKIVIAGGNSKGTLYGVYTFLEKFLGCRYYSPDDRVIPHQEKIVLGRINEKQVPVIRFREMYFPACLDSNYLDWHKLDRHDDGSWGMWVHTFDDLVPASEYFTDHPEYFSETGGVRIPEGQLCLSDKELLPVLVSNLKKKIQAKPAATFWSVSQNDNYIECQCSACRELNNKFRASSGTMIDFVNHVAEEFPDKVISTLAYQYTRSAPHNIRPAENVNVMLCTIECNRSVPIADDPGSASFTQDIADWGKLTNNIILWDYVVQFRNLVSPFPNLRVLQPNLKFFVDNNCTMMFQQGSGSLISEFVELRSYLIAELLWDPETDLNEAIDDFLNGYYGAAGPFIRRYIDLMHDALQESDDNLWIYGYPYDAVDSYLTKDLIRQYEIIFDQASAAVNEDPILLKRVRIARLPLEFAVLDISLHEPWPEMSYFDMINGQRQVRQDMVKRLEMFVAGCGEACILNLEEHGTSPQEYQGMVLEMLSRSSETSLALNKPVLLLTEFSTKYDAGGENALTDGKRGIADYHFNWLGFEGNDLLCVIDLGEEKNIREIRADFLQDIQSWVFLPVKVDFYFSNDDFEYTLGGTVKNNVSDREPGIFIQSFGTIIYETRARYIKIYAENMKKCPDWHIGAGQKCWIFTDEIVVR